MSAPVIDNVLGLGLLRQPKVVLFGPGQRRQLPKVVAPLGSHVLICTDARMATTVECDDLRASLGAMGLTVSLYAEVEPDLPRSNILAIHETFGHAGIEVVIGLGGGSCLDMAKVASLMLTHGGDIRDYYGENLVPGPTMPVVTVPTTGGTGAEVSCISVVFDEERGVKIGVASAHLEAHTAVIDPELTLTCPPGLTAATGADALSHLIESFTDRAKNPTTEEIERHLYVGKNVLTDIYCRTGLSLLNRSLERVVADPLDIQARADTMLAAFCGGMALNTAGTASAHAIQSPIGNLTHTPHGWGVGALLPYVMRANLRVRVDVFAEMADLFGVSDPAVSALDNAKAAILRVEQLLTALGVPLSLRELGVTEDQLDFIADQAMLSTRLLANNPRELSRDDVADIVRRAFLNDRSWPDVA